MTSADRDTAIKYGLIAGLIALAIIAIVALFGQNLAREFETSPYGHMRLDWPAHERAQAA